jgi:tRNA (pseudouridine54-N1)-methyltransferase
MSPASARCFVIVLGSAMASPDFSLDDLPGSSGRLDVGLRCLKAGLLISHGVRRDAAVYLVLGGGPRAPRTMRIDGATAQFVRPDERALAGLVKKSLAAESAGSAFARVRPGIALADGGLEAALDDIGPRPLYVLEENAPDIRSLAGLATALARAPGAFVFGDHTGLDTCARALLAARGATAVGLGPVSLHAEDAVAVLWNEIDRCEVAGRERIPGSAIEAAEWARSGSREATA